MPAQISLVGLLALVGVGLFSFGDVRPGYLAGRYHAFVAVALAALALGFAAADLLTLALAVGVLGFALAGLVALGTDAASARAATRLLSRHLAVLAVLAGSGASVALAGGSTSLDGFLARVDGPVAGVSTVALVAALALLAGLAPLQAGALAAVRQSVPHVAAILVALEPALALVALWRVTRGAESFELALSLALIGATSLAAGVALLWRALDGRVWIAGLSLALSAQAVLAISLGARDAFAGALVALLLAPSLALLAPLAARLVGTTTLVDVLATVRNRPFGGTLSAIAVAIGIGLLPTFGFAGRTAQVEAALAAGPAGLPILGLALVALTLVVAAALAALRRAASAETPERHPIRETTALGRAALLLLGLGAALAALAWPATAAGAAGIAATGATVLSLALGVWLGLRPASSRREATRPGLIARLDKRLGSPLSRLAGRLRAVDWVEVDLLTLAAAALWPLSRASAWLLDGTLGGLARS